MEVVPEARPVSSNATIARVLVADVGGTNARFALAENSTTGPPVFRNTRTLACADHEDLASAIRAYLSSLTVRCPAAAVIAVAGPVTRGIAKLTNLAWSVSEPELCDLGFGQVRLVNDYCALAAAAPALGDRDLLRVGPALARASDENVAIIGAGTGLGVSALVRERGRNMTLVGEGGHISFAPETDAEIKVLQFLGRRYGRVSAERILSGPGLVQLYRTLCAMEGSAPQFDAAPDVIELAVRNGGSGRRAVEMFCEIFGAVAGDLALTFGARGGVLMSGGLTLALGAFLERGGFRRRFEGKGRLADLVKTIPTHLITRSDAALLGCARLGCDLARAGAS